MADRFDLDAIEADDALLDLLAAGGDSAWSAGEHDPALKLLADLRLAVEVEDELPVETIDDPESFLARCAALNPVTDPFARKMAARGLALGVAAVAALSVSGVAAAVTGDPLSPYEEVIKKVVDAVRPQSSSPLEQLDGLPVVDKTKIVKVAKDYQKKQEEAKAADDKAADDRLNGLTDTLPADLNSAPTPPLARPPVAEVPTKVEQPLTDPAPENPVDQPTTDPTTEPSSDPSTPPSTDPSTPPTSDPSTPPPSTEPSTPPSSDPTNPQTQDPTTPPPSDTGSTENGDGGGNPGQPSTQPSSGGETGAGDTGTGTGNTETGTETGDTGTGTGSDQTEPSDQTGDEPTESTPVEEAVDEVVPVLPTPTGEPAEPTRLAEYLAKTVDESQAKHSSGKPAVGFAKSQYAKGKHSTGQYAEGRHAAIARAHGSMAPMTLRQILTVLNGPMGSR